ncbi:MAG: hypothetical protein ACHQJ5_02675 [Vicinamibacteria bacterium]
MKTATTLVIAVLALAAAATALAGGDRVPAKVSLELGPAVGLFKGKVSADDSACYAGRKVRIVRISGDDVRVGKTYTKINGHYKVQTTETSGDWIAKVKHETLAGVDCKGAQSKVRSAG